MQVFNVLSQRLDVGASPEFAGLTITGTGTFGDTSNYALLKVFGEDGSAITNILVADPTNAYATLYTSGGMEGAVPDANGDFDSYDDAYINYKSDGDIYLADGGGNVYIGYESGGSDLIWGRTGTGGTLLGLGGLTVTGATITGCSVFGLNSAVFQPTVDSTTFFQVNDKDGNNEFTIDTVNNALLFGYTKLGTIEGSYNFINGSAFGSESGYTYCVAVGTNIANLATGTVNRNNIIGHDIANSSTANVNRNNLVGSNIANTATTNITYNNLVGYNLANSATPNVNYNNLVGYNLASEATGNVNYNVFVGSEIANSATGAIYGNYAVGNTLINAITGDVKYSFISGYRCLYNTTNETNCERVVAFPYESLSGSSAADLDNAIAIGYQAGLNNAYNNPALFGTQAVADAHKQIVLGSAYYTGGVRLYGADLFFTSATPYQTLWCTTHSDANESRKSRFNFVGEQSGNEVSTLARIEAGHDGTGDDEKGYKDTFINDGDDGDSPTHMVRVNSVGLGVRTKMQVSLFESNGGEGLAIETVTGNTTLDATHSTVLVNASGNVTITLPTAASAYNSTDKIGRIYEVKKIDADANTVTIDPDGSELIEFASNLVLTDQGEAVTFQTNGTAWYII